MLYTASNQKLISRIFSVCIMNTPVKIDYALFDIFTTGPVFVVFSGQIIYTD